jgi:hypothetical protein
MNVGERATFTATVTGGTGTPVYQWLVSGDIIKDYSETTQFEWSVTPMAAADFQGSSLSFYWKPDPTQIHPLNGIPVARTVSLTVTVGADICTAESIISVERNDSSIDRQAEDPYVSWNHRLSPTTTMTRVVNEHRLWHANNKPTNTNYDGTLFFDFHHALIGRFNSWRAEFGYPPLVSWDTGTALPTGTEVDHLARNSSYTLYPKPTWFAATGGSATRRTNGRPCDTSGGQNDLFDFLTRLHLGCAATQPYHDGIHQRVGGDMLSTSWALRDPIFWRWHSFLDGIGQEWLAGPAPAAPLTSAPQPTLLARIMDAVIPPVIAQSHRPGAGLPEVVYQTPFRLFTFLTEAPSEISVTFSKTVAGVKASDLKVNGSAATTVSSRDDGKTYVFSGFRKAQGAQAVVKLDAGEIKDLAGNTFEGTSWKYELESKGKDTDGDGMKNDDEAKVWLSNPRKKDTDDDGLPDKFETDNACLDVLEDQAHPHDMGGDHIPGNDDQDGDGISDLDEFAQGSDPCAK